MKKKELNQKVKVNNYLTEGIVRARDLVRKEVGISYTSQLEKAFLLYFATYHREMLLKNKVDLWKQ